MNYTDNYQLRKPENTDPVNIEDLNYNADEIDSKIKELDERIDNNQALAIRTTEKSKAQNKHTKQVTGYGILSIPNNAQGQVSASVKGLTATNLIKNGDFSKGKTNWVSINAVVDGVGEYIAEAQYGNAYQEIPNHANYRNHIVYFCGDIKSTSPNVALGVTDGLVVGNAPHDGSNTFKKLSRISTISPNSTLLRVRIIDTRTSGWDKIYFDNIIFIDLTSIFGVGNEPTKEECDKIFSNYFDGTKSTVSASRLKSVGKNLFDGKVYDQMSNGGIVDGREVYKLSHGARQFWSFKGKPNTQYRVYFHYKKDPSSLGITLLEFLYSDGTKSLIRALASTTWTNEGSISEENKTLIGLTQTYVNVGTTYFDKNKFMLTEGTVATPYEPYTESTQYLPNVGELRSLPNGTKDEINVTNRKLIKRIGEKSNIANGMVIDFADMTEGGTYYAWNDEGETETGVKGDTLGIDATTLIYQLATPVEVPVDAVGNLVVYPNGTITVEPCISGFMTEATKVVTTEDIPIKELRKVIRFDISDTGQLVKTDVTSDVTVGDNNTSLTIANFVAGKTYFYDCSFDESMTTKPEIVADVEVDNGVVSHDYQASAADWVLTTNEAKATMLVCNNAGGAAKIIAPASDGKMYVVKNDSGQTITIKTASSTGMTVANDKTATVIYTGTDFIKISEV